MAERPTTLPTVAGPQRDALLATKLHVPRPRPGSVPRPRLLERLDEGMDRQLVLVCTPAGFGKTTLLGDWAHRGRWPVAWLSLDAGDNDPARFWRHAAAALDTVRPGIAEQASRLLQGPQPGSGEAVATVVVNQLADATEAVVLVLDDYHLIQAQSVHQSLGFLLEHLPSSLRVVLASRADPPLALARLRARGGLTELRAADLRFTEEQAAALLRDAAGLDLPATSLAALAARTEGWVAGLQLAGLSLQGHPDPAGFVATFSGSHRYVLDYLAEEVLDRQPADLRRFLLETSVLDRLSAELCEAVTGQPDGQAMLERVERANLFLVPLDEVRGWWRYHQLFADLLRARLARVAPGRVPLLHRAAAAWSEAHGLVDDAIGHALAAGDAAGAARLVERHLDQMLRQGEGVLLQRRLEALPEDVVGSRPGLVLAQAMAALHRGRLDAVDRLLEHADQVFDLQAESERPQVPTDGGMVSKVPAALALLRAELAASRGDTDQAAGFARLALAHIAAGESGPGLWARWLVPLADWMSGRLDDAERGFAAVLAEARASADAHPLVSSCYTLGRVQRARGELSTALRTLRAGLREATEDGRQSAFHAAEAHLGIAQVLYERNQLDDALQHATQSLALSRSLFHRQLPALAMVTMAWVRQATGDPVRAREVMDEGCRRMPRTQITSLYCPAPAERARLLLAQGDLDEATRWTERAGLGAEDQLSYPAEGDYLVLARVLLARGAAHQARGLLERLGTLAASQGRIESLLRVRVLQSLALQATGDHDAALAVLAQALALAAPEGYLRVFVDEGAPMAALLGRVPATGDADAAVVPPAYLGHLLQAFRDAGSPVGKRGRRAAAAVAGLPEPLSRREREVLALLAQGKANRAIGEELVITLDTVKRHVTHILSKLGAANRTQAVARARELGLLEERGATP